MQNEWPKAAENIVSYREIALSVGHNPPPPIILTNVSCAESRDEAHDRAMNWLGKKWQSIDNHYHFSDGHLATVKGYESYGKMAKTYARLQSEEERVRATEFYVKIQIVGTPDDCIEQIAELQRVTGTDHVVTEFSYGGIPHGDAEKNMRLFASRVLPVLQSDAAFATPPAPAAAPKDAAATGIFAGARRIGRQPIAGALPAGRVPQAREAAQIGEKFVEQLQPVAPADMPRVQGHVEVTAALVLRIEFRLPVPRQGVGMLETGALAGKHQKELIVEMVVIGQRQQRPPAGKVGDPVMRYVVGQAVPHIGVPGIEQQIHRVRADRPAGKRIALPRQ